MTRGRALGVGLGAAAGAAVMVVGLASPLGPLPPLGPTLNPVTGIFASVLRPLPGGELSLPGLRDRVDVREDQWGIPWIAARNERDLFLAQGYLAARQRLFQMDLLRRQGRGRLAEIVGAAALPSDRLAVVLALGRTADMAAERLGREDPEAMDALAAYAEGVNAWIREAKRTHALPLGIRLLGYSPEPWSAADSLVIQGIMTRMLAFDTTPIERQLLGEALGEETAGALFPEMPPNQQWPYAPGPYASGAPVDRAALESARMPFGQGAGVGGPVLPGEPPGGSAGGRDSPGNAGGESGLHPEAEGSLALSPLPVQLARQIVAALPGHGGGGRGESPVRTLQSNSWAVSGALTDTGRPYLAGDPHLPLTLPAIWWEVHLESADWRAHGVSIPGTPGIVIGHNGHVAWSLTNTGNQQAFFYEERVSETHPGHYLYAGRWLPFARFETTIPVRDAPPERFAVQWTVHGPVLPSGLPGVPPVGDRTVSLAWTGYLFSNDVGALLRLLRGRDETDVRRALARWGAPVQTFAWATASGHIGLVAAGHYVVVSHGAGPHKLLDGSDPANDWQGLIPYDRVPAVSDPPWGFVASANQRPVGEGYPFPIGAAMGFDAGYRATTLVAFLGERARQGQPITRADMEQLQASHADALARRIVPLLVEAASRAGLSDAARRAVQLLAAWDGTMAPEQAAPTVWWTFLRHYVRAIFAPWWQQAGLSEQGSPFSLDRYEPGSAGWQGALVAATEVLTTGAPAGSYERLRRFWDDPVRGVTRTPELVMVQALENAVQELLIRLGGHPDAWRWGDIHRRLIPAITGPGALGRGPFPAAGGSFTVDVSPGETSTTGPSWRMIVDLAAPGRSVTVYPGGQAEDPTSPHYADQLPVWMRSGYKGATFP